MRRFLALGVLALASVFIAAAQGAPQTARDYIVVLKPDANRASAVADAIARGGKVPFQYEYALNGFAVSLPEQAVAGIERNPNVVFVGASISLESHATCPLNTTSGFPEQCIPPGIERIGGDQSSTRSGDGRRTVSLNVAVMDGGIDTGHPDLTRVEGTDCVGDRTRNVNHGTFAGGVIGALDNGFGVVGVAPGVRLSDVRAFNKHGLATTAQIICGIDYITSTRVDSDPTNDIVVANGSFGGFVRNADDGNCGRSNRDAMHLAICNSVAAGVNWVVSAGNEGKDIQDYAPAAYQEVLAVTAMADYDGMPGGLAPACRLLPEARDDDAAFFSNFATLNEDKEHIVAAPGVCVVSTHGVDFFLPQSDTDYAIWTGTSFSAPHVAGTVALCIASGTCSGLTPAQIVQKIVADATAYNTASKNSGYGFRGDPLRPISGKHYGYLIRAGLY